MSRLTISFTTLMFLMAPAGSPFGQESESFVMERVTFGSTADRASSSGYETTVTFAQEGPVGSVSFCNQGPLLTAGFWSLLGDTPVPVFLDVSLDPVSSSKVQLSWSGSASIFEVFRAAAPHALPTPDNTLMLTSSCGAADSPPESNVITYYVIVPAES